MNDEGQSDRIEQLLTEEFQDRWGRLWVTARADNTSSLRLSLQATLETAALPCCHQAD